MKLLYCVLKRGHKFLGASPPYCKQRLITLNLEIADIVFMVYSLKNQSNRFNILNIQNTITLSMDKIALKHIYAKHVNINTSTLAIPRLWNKLPSITSSWQQILLKQNFTKYFGNISSLILTPETHVHFIICAHVGSAPSFHTHNRNSFWNFIIWI